MRKSLLLVVAASFVAMPSIAPRRVRAQPVSSRVFEGIAAEQVDGRREARISFSVPIRYFRHTPRSLGDSVHVQFFPLNVTSLDAPAFFRRESLQIPEGFPLPIAEVSYQGVVAGQPFLDVDFDRSTQFEVRQGEDLRSIVITFPPDPASVPTPRLSTPSTAPAPAPAPADQRVDEMMDEARRAMTAGEFDRAVAIYTKALSLPEHSESRDALEFLALARERKGQLAHAKAEYETYLERYPDGEGAVRVRQRIDALVTARAEPVESKIERPPEASPLDLQSFGSIYVGYRRELRYPDDEPSLTVDSTLFSDVHVETRLRTDRYTVRTRMTGGYRHEFLDGGSDETRTNSLFIEAEDHPHGLRGSIGRRSLSTGGILGRFDGIRLTYDLTDRMMLGFTSGFPVDSPTHSSIDFDRYFAGVSLDVAKFLDGLDGQIYAIGQMDASMIDRAAIGTELRYFKPGRFAAAFLDYDVYFNELNLAQVLGNWQVTPSTLLTTFLDYRLVPTLTAQNALQGQLPDELADLLDSFSRKEIRRLARDRTARNTTLSFGINQDVGNRLQLSVDFTATDYSGTVESGGVDAFEGNGFEFSYATQLIQSDFLKPGGVGILGFRYVDSASNDLVTATLDGRYPITQGLRANPRLRADYRMTKDSGDMLSVLPSLRLDYRIWKVVFDSELALQWRPIRPAGNDDLWGYSMTFGLRYDY